jgi:hypothetical protein
MGYLYKFLSKSSVCLAVERVVTVLVISTVGTKYNLIAVLWIRMLWMQLFPPFSLSTQYSALLSLDIAVDRLSLYKQIYRPRSDIDSRNLTMYFSFRPPI